MFLAVSSGASQQTKCSEGSPPEIRGLKLGLTVDEVAKKFNGIKIHAANDVGWRELVIQVSPANLDFSRGVVNLDRSSIVSTRTFPLFDGVGQLGLAFLDDRIYQIAVAYTTPPRWRNVDEFAGQLSLAFGLPVASWEDDEDGVREIQCGRFRIRAKLDPDPVIRIFDPSAPIVISARKVEREEKKRGAFKP